MEDQRGYQTRGSAVAIVIGMNCGKLIVSHCSFKRNRQIIRDGQPACQILHQSRHIARLGRQIDDAAAPAVLNHVLSISVGRRLHSRFAASHDQGVEPPNDGFGQRAAGFGQLFGLVQCRIIAEHLSLIALPARKVLPIGDDLDDLRLGQQIALNRRRVVRREEPGRLPEAGEHLRRDGQRVDRLTDRLNSHQPSGDGRSDRVFRREALSILFHMPTISRFGYQQHTASMLLLCR